MTNELKPCPFCGGEAMSYDYEAGNFYPNYIVECCNCSARIKPVNADSYDAEKKAVKKWNTRQPAFDWKPIEELEELIEVVLLDKSKAYSVGIRLGRMVRVSSLNNSSQEFYCDIPVNYFTHYALLTPPQTNQS